MEKGCNNCKYRDLSFDNKPCKDCMHGGGSFVKFEQKEGENIMGIGTIIDCVTNIDCVTCNTCKYSSTRSSEKPCFDCRMCNLYEPKENKEEKEEEISQDTVKILSNGYANEKYYIYAKCWNCFGEFEIREDLWTYNNTMSKCLTSKCPLCGDDELLPHTSRTVPPIVVARIEANSK